MEMDRPRTEFGSSSEEIYGMRDPRAGLLILADDVFLDDVAGLAEAAQFRLLDIVPLGQAMLRLDMQVGCDVILLFCTNPSALLERLLVQVETLAVQNRCRAGVAGWRPGRECHRRSWSRRYARPPGRALMHW